MMQQGEPGMEGATTTGHLPSTSGCLLHFFLSFIVIFIIVQRSIYHKGIYIITTHYNKFADYEILPILVLAYENNFTKSFEGEFEYAEHLPALLRTM